jgi:predicted nucleotidyltransferase
MDRPEIEARLVAFFERRLDVAAAYLFGSFARGEAREGSDVDVAILFRDEPPRTLAAVPAEIEDALTRALGRSTQVVVLNGAPADLVHRVLRDGRLVCEHDKAARVRYEVLKRNEYFDLLPTLRRYRRPRSGAKP